MNRNVPFFGSGFMGIIFCLVLLVGGTGLLPGPRHIDILHDTNTDSTNLARLWEDLRADPDWLKYKEEKKHELDIVPYNAVNKDGRPSPHVEALKAAVGSNQLPAAVFSTQEGTVVGVTPLKPDTDLKKFKEIVQEYGG